MVDMETIALDVNNWTIGWSPSNECLDYCQGFIDNVQKDYNIVPYAVNLLLISIIFSLYGSRFEHLLKYIFYIGIAYNIISIFSF